MAVVATGFFDGVHLGHRRVVETLVAAASDRGEQSVVVTFWPHPRVALQDDARDLCFLSSLDEKKSMLSKLGVDRIEVLDFTRKFSMMDTEDFIRDVLIGKFSASMMVLGYDNRIGHDMLPPQEAACCARSLGIEAVVCEGLSSGEGPDMLSSTKIRLAVKDGSVRLASTMLGYDYCLSGMVVSGSQIGRTINFPTANIKPCDPLKQVPGAGVYLTVSEISGDVFHSMTNIDNNGKIESHIFGFNSNIYGLGIKTTFLRKVRDEMVFDNILDLKRQLEKDYNICKTLISGEYGQL